MLHQLTNETLLPLVQAVQEATGQRPHLSTVLRWGSRGSAGIKLETVCLGGRKYSSKEAALRFVESVTEAKAGGTPATSTVTPRQSERAADRSAKKLADRLAKPAKK
ncbi:MAG TPA: DUF1580 domain-containing protein [Pirellula sp.]|nr:DUF1580 domain-containing protein [Pirellula sp.]